MNLSKLQIGLVGSLLLVVGIVIGQVTASSGLKTETVTEASDLSTPDPLEAAIAAQEKNVEQLQRDFDASMDELYSADPPLGYRPDPEIQRGQRHAVEMNEMLCKQTGQNCEFAAMARRQYVETYGPM